MPGVQGLCACPAPAGECRHISKGKDKEVALVGVNAVKAKGRVLTGYIAFSSFPQVVNVQGVYSKL